jgi:PAS domain S-box-containing protein
MTLKQQVWLFLGGLFALLFAVDLWLSHGQLKREMRAAAETDARTVYDIILAMREVYHQQFLDSELPIRRNTVGFLPAHALSRIGEQFAGRSDTGIRFNNVSDRPRNPDNQADRHELAAMAWYRANPQASEKIDEIDEGGHPALLYTAPLWIEEYCLNCHGKPQTAPAGLLAADDPAFGYKIGDLRGLISIRIPTAAFEQRFWQIWGQQLLVKIGSYLALLLGIGLLLERLVVQRLARLEAGARRIAAGDYALPPGPRGSDEIDRLAEAFGNMAEDIRERETHLRKLSLAVEQSPESIVITDLHGTIEYVNACFVHTTGYRPHEVIGENPRILRSGDTPPEVYQALWETLTAGRIWRGEFNNRRRDGSAYVESAVIAPLHQEDGRITHYVAVKQDITAQKRAAAELAEHREHLEELVAARTRELHQAKEQAEQASRAKSSFLANMSHEIRTPLNAILGMAHLIRRGRLDPLQGERLRKLEGASSHLLQTINGVLDLSKIESGKLELERTEVRLDEIVENIGSILHDKFAEKGLAYSNQLPPLLPPLLGDPTRLQQALLNYLGNAVKFTAHGSIHLQVDILAEADSRLQLRFAVSDSGIGIAADALGRLFAAFEQADNSTTRRFGGSGLGLAIVRHIARAMDGDAGAESEPGRGSRFWFTAWLDKGRPAPAPALPPLAAESALKALAPGLRLLLADDEPINREITRLLLEDVGLQVDTAGDGAQALAAARERHYDLILMDMQMPVMDGLAATRAILALPGRSTVPVIATTANAFLEDKAACLQAGMVDVITKPLAPEIFYAKLHQWISICRKA